MNKFTFFIVTLCLIATCLSAAAPTNKNNNNGLGKFEVTIDNSDSTPDDDNNLLFSYDPDQLRPKYVTTSLANSNLKSSSYIDLERETLSSANNKKVASVVDPSASRGSDAESSGSPNLDKIKAIAFNSREVRLVGPNQREVEMKDDVASKVVVALENLQKEASDVWSQVNEKLDKGWTDLKKSEVWGQVNEKLDKGWIDLKTMVEGVVTPSNSKSAINKNN